MGNVTLTVPTDGYVFLIVTASVVTFGDQTMCTVGLGTTSSSLDLHQTWVGDMDGPGSTSWLRKDFSVTSTAMVPVTKGTPCSMLMLTSLLSLTRKRSISVIST